MNNYINNLFSEKSHIKLVKDFKGLLDSPFKNQVNAMCFQRELKGDFNEIVNKFSMTENIKVIEKNELLSLDLSENGKIAREILLNDLEILTLHGADPVLNIIAYYESDEEDNFFPTDVYSYHVDRSPIPVDTFLCTYIGDSSEIIANENAIQKIQIPEIKNELINKYHIKETEFDSFVKEHFFDLHYQAINNCQPISLGLGNLWKIATDNPVNPVPPCVHRAPKEKNGQKRLLLIC